MHIKTVDLFPAPPRKSWLLVSLCKDFVSNLRVILNLYPSVKLFSFVLEIVKIDTRVLQNDTKLLVGHCQVTTTLCIIQREGHPSVKCHVVQMYTLETLNVSVFSLRFQFMFVWHYCLAHEIYCCSTLNAKNKNPAVIKGLIHN